MTTPNDPDLEAQYKSLQRRYDRQRKENSTLRSEVQDMRASASRLEKDMEGIFAFLARQDPETKPAVDAYLQSRAGQQAYDSASVQTNRRIAELLGDDDDWDDEKFAPARSRLAEATQSGDASRFEDVVQLVREAVGGLSAGPLSRQDLEDAVRQAMATQDPSANRVDTGSSSTTNPGQLRSDALSAALEAGVSHEDRQALLQKAYDSMSA